MAFNSNAPKQDYEVVAGQTEFPFLFKIYSDDEIKVYDYIDGVSTLLTLNVDYTVVINGDEGGSITLATGAELGHFINLRRQLSFDRYVEYQTSGDMLAETLNADQDYQTYLMSDIQVSLIDSLRVPAGTPGFSGDLPAPLAEAYLRWAADGRTIENDTTPPTWRNETVAARDATLGYRDETLTARDNAANSASAANSSALLAQAWAETAEDTEVIPGSYSAYHWAQKAEELANIAGYILKTGDTMTGHLEVPAGATGNQAPRVSEVVKPENYGTNLVGGTAKYKLDVDVLYITTDGTEPGV